MFTIKCWGCETNIMLNDIYDSTYCKDGDACYKRYSKMYHAKRLAKPRP